MSPYSISRRWLSLLGLCLVLIAISPNVSADSIDWVNTQYILQANKDSSTSTPRDALIRAADITAKKGPWTVATGSSIKPPSGDMRDYLSWAPYHWPDCNWCSGPRTHLASGVNRTHGGGADGSRADTSAGTTDETSSSSSTRLEKSTGYGTSTSSADTPSKTDDGLPDDLPFDVPIFPPGVRRVMKRVRRQELPAGPGLPTDASLFPPLPDITSLLHSAIHTAETTTSDRVISGTPTPAQAPAKTGQPKPTKTQAHDSGKASCTPSPSKSLAPSATWTTCAYAVRDGKVNPDVRDPKAVESVVDMTQAVQYNAFAYAFTNKPAYSTSATSFIRKFFLDPKTGMNPQVKYGQVIRGPGDQDGQYLGILDFRGMVKVANAVRVLKASGAKEWDSATDKQLKDWASKYAAWLRTSDLGKKGNDAPNNHGSFYASQFAAVSYMTDDKNAAASALDNFFKKQFLDQIAASGEQPFEAVRTRPYHYRCFNLEALITSAKLGDELGLNLWIAKSKYGATIQTALDFVMSQNPKEEDVSDIFPHVAAVAAAYGDPSGKYDKFLKSKDKSYGKAPYYLYNSPKAFKSAPAADTKGGSSSSGAASSSSNAGKGGKGNKGKDNNGKSKSELITNAKLAQADEDPGSIAPAVEDPPSDDMPVPGGAPNSAPDVPNNRDSPVDDGSMPTDAGDTTISPPQIPWECPAAFATQPAVQLDDGLFVTCDQLKPFYGYVKNVGKAS